LSKNDIIRGVSEKFIRAVDLAKQMGKVNSPVLLTGEVGTGKDSFAKLILSENENNPRFEKIDASRLSLREFRESIYGNIDKPGILEDENVCIYFDNIELLDQENQYRLLQIFEYGEFAPEGSSKKRKAVSKLIFSSKFYPGSGGFSELREDFFHRMSLLTIHIPPLRERKEDIPILSEHFVRLLNERYGKNISISPLLIDFFHDYFFHGNVRELKNILEGLVVTFEKNYSINPDNLPDWVWEKAQNQDSGFSVMPLRDMEKRMILKTLRLVNGNRNKAAEILGISERNLYRKIKELEN